MAMEGKLWMSKLARRESMERGREGERRGMYGSYVEEGRRTEKRVQSGKRRTSEQTLLWKLDSNGKRQRGRKGWEGTVRLALFDGPEAPLVRPYIPSTPASTRAPTCTCNRPLAHLAKHSTKNKSAKDGTKED